MQLVPVSPLFPSASAASTAVCQGRPSWHDNAQSCFLTPAFHGLTRCSPFPLFISPLVSSASLLAPMYHARAETSPAAAAAAPPAASSAEARLRAMKHAHHDVSDDDASDSDDDGTDPRQEALQQYLSQAAPGKQRCPVSVAQEAKIWLAKIF